MDPRGVRNNNFGNIKDGPFAQGLPGYSGSDGTFATFASPDHGWDAMDRLLQGYGKKGLATAADVVGRWAPTDDGNNVNAYSQYVAQKIGVDPGAKLDMNDPQIRSKLAKAMANYENGEGPMKSAFTGNSKMAPTGLDQNMLDYQNPAPALSAQAMAGGRGMYGLSDGMITQDDKPVYDLSDSMQGAGAWLMGINNPHALGALASLRKNKEGGSGHYDEKTGTFYRFDKNGRPSVTGTNPNWEKAEQRDRQKAYDKASDDGFIKTYQDLQSRGSDAQNQLSDISAAKELLSRADPKTGKLLVDQGFGGDSLLQLKSLYQRLGGDPSGLAEGQEAKALMQKLTLAIKDAGGKNNMPGSLSDKDLAFLISSGASLGNDSKANQRILDTYEKHLQRNQELAELARTHNGGRLDNTFYDKVSAHDKQRAEKMQRMRGADSFWMN